MFRYSGLYGGGYRAVAPPNITDREIMAAAQSRTRLQSVIRNCRHLTLAVDLLVDKSPRTE
jgi:hypothetical protein